MNVSKYSSVKDYNYDDCDFENESDHSDGTVQDAMEAGSSPNKLDGRDDGFWTKLVVLQTELEEQYEELLVKTDRTWAHRRDEQLGTPDKLNMLMMRIKQVLDLHGPGSPDVIDSQDPNTLKLVDRTSWENVGYNEFEGVYLLETAQKMVVPQKLRRDRLLIILTRICDLIVGDSQSTRRNLLYLDTDIYGGQTVVDDLVDDIVALLRVPRALLRVETTGKGLCYGKLFIDRTDSTVDYSMLSTGLQIPQNFTDVTGMRTNAKYVLLVEKDATFQHIIISKRIKNSDDYIVVTGKGYPDAYTRQFVRLLYEFLRIPILALVDCDPHGIEIMCTYRYGSVTLAAEHMDLVTAQVRWLGVLPSDAERLGVHAECYIPMDIGDQKKIIELISRPYVQRNSRLLEELDYLRKRDTKMEIQALNELGDVDYLFNHYIDEQIFRGNFI